MKAFKNHHGCKVAQGSKLYELLELPQTAENVKLVNEHYKQIDTEFRRLHGLPEKGPIPLSDWSIGKHTALNS